VRAPKFAFLLILACLAAAALGGCGGGGDSTGASTAAGETQAQATTDTTTAEGSKEAGGAKESKPRQSNGEEKPFTPKPHHDSGGGSKQFEVKGGDNSIQEFGEEGSETELEKAASALHVFLDARAARSWATACAQLSSGVVKSFGQLAASSAKLKNAGCPQLLAALSEGVPTSNLVEAAQANVGSLRFEGDQAFLIYRGAGNAVYAISMAKEDGDWKVAGLSGTPLG
jgi:hypothetical protein